MVDSWSAEQKAWLIENYHIGTINDTIAAMEAAFGVRRSRQSVFVMANKLGLHKKPHGVDRGRKCERTMRWTDPRFAREKEWMLENDTTESVFPTIQKFRDEFGVTLTRSQVSLFRSTHGNRKRRAHGGGAPSRPVGATRIDSYGWTLVKVKEWPDKPCTKDNWRFAHHLAWEEANGRPVPDDCMIFMADGDKGNLDPDNLVAVPRKLVGIMNSPSTPRWSDRETLLACIEQARLKAAILDAEGRKPRTCMVCGGEFVVENRNYRHPPQTCPECRAAGRQARGDRGDKKPVICPVCGQTFARVAKNNVRCPECCRAKPHYSWKAHKRFFDKHGTRA